MPSKKPLPMSPVKFRDRLRWAQRLIEKRIVNGECWELPNAHHGGSRGYSRISVGRRKMRYAHRVVMEIILEVRLRKVEEVCHRCDNPACWRPEHLFIGNRRVNALDCLRKDRSSGAKLSVVKAAEAKALLDSGVPDSEVAEQTSLSISGVRKIKYGETWAKVI